MLSRGGRQIHARIACSAVFVAVLFAEIREEHLPSAGTRRAELNQFLKFVFRDSGPRRVSHLVYEKLMFHFIAPAEKQYAVGLLAVASRASRLLIIPFYVFRNIVMYHESYVALVYTHPECDRSHNYARFAALEFVLVFGSLFLRKPRVV